MCTLSKLLRHVQVSLAVDSNKKCSWASWKWTFDICWELKSMLPMLWKPPFQIVYIWCHFGSGSIRSDFIQFYDGILLYLDDFARMDCLATSVKLQLELEFRWRISTAYVVCFFWNCSRDVGRIHEEAKMLYPGDSIRDLFGMVKTWPFEGVKWPPTRGWKGHFESPGWFFN